MKKRFLKAYVEITNVCNLDCSFCHKTSRPPRFMTAEEFSVIAEKIRPYTDFVYLHLMGEPLLHPELESILLTAKNKGLKVIITTNGTLLSERYESLISGGIFKLSVSLHSSEGNGKALPSTVEYCKKVFDACEKTGKAGIISVLRLWNENGENSQNGEIIRLLRERFPLWEVNKSGYKVGEGVYLEYGEKFDWPDLEAEPQKTSFCYGLRDHFGVLCDGTVVPCCLDSDGVIDLGNLFEKELSEILEGERAKRLFDGFTQRIAVEKLCQKCGYASEFRKSLDKC